MRTVTYTTALCAACKCLITLYVNSAHARNSDDTKFYDRQVHDPSTGNMKRHIKECASNPNHASQQRTMAEFAAGVTYSPARFRAQLALWVARHHRPFAIIEDPELRALFRMLYSRVDIPLRVTVARNVHLILRDAKEHLIDYLKVRDSATAFRTTLM